jgi:hypothetical protein
VVAMRQNHGTSETEICPGDRLTNTDSAPEIRCPANSPSWETCPIEHTYGGPTGRRCCTFLLYSLFELFEFRFLPVELSGLEPLTSCMP